MGLDIMAHSQLELVPEEELEGLDTDNIWEECWDNGWCILGESYGFTDREHPLKLNVPYEVCGGTYGFRAGSYSGYNQWRDQLAQMAGYENAEEVWRKRATDETFDGPFADLIDFSDCEGVLGTTVAAKLFKDFKEFEDRAKQWADDNLTESEGYCDREWFLERYHDWMCACEEAADNGCIIFG